MKKSTLTFLILGIGMVGTLLISQSCNKVKDALKVNVPLQMADVTYTIPVLTDTGTTVWSQQDVYVNVDSIIRAYNNTLSMDNIKSVKIASCNITLIDGTDSNNFAALKSCEIDFSSNINTSNTSLASLVDNPDVTSYALTVPVNSDLELKDYFKATTFTYKMSGTLRRPVTAPLTCKATFKFNVQAGL